MEKQTLRRLLDEVAQQEFPDTATIWPRLDAALSSSRPARLPRRLTLVLAALLLLALVTTVYAAVQGVFAPGLKESLVTSVNETQTIDNASVTLQWAYLDTNRLALGYAITMPKGQGANARYRITDADQSFYMGDGASDNTQLADAQTSISFNVGFYHQLPPNVHLRIEMTLDPYIQTETPQGEGAGAYGGGGGGGGDGITPEPGINFDMNTHSDHPIGPFVFEVMVPVVPSVELDVNQSLTVNGISLTLNHLSISPSMTKADVCYDLPSDHDWAPEVNLTIGQEPGRFFSSDLSRFPETAARRCSNLIFYAAYDRKPTTLTLEIPSLKTSERYREDLLPEYEKILKDNGIEIEITSFDTEGGIMFNIIKQPENADVAPIFKQANDVFREIVTGPWRFVVQVP